MTTRPPTVLVAEEQSLFRAAICHALAQCADLQVAGEAGSVDEARALTR